MLWIRSNTMPIVLTFESWLRRWEWYEYAIRHPADVPCVLVDRSQCVDPFFDHHARGRPPRPLISGLCRPRARYAEGQIYVYVARVDLRVLEALGRSRQSARGPVYLGVAALRVHTVHSSHRAAASTFCAGQYASPAATSAYPPNLAYEAYPGQALRRECCITHDVRARRPSPHTPSTSTPTMHRRHYTFYRARQSDQPVAECRFMGTDARPALVLDPYTAPIFSTDDWGGAQMNQRGIRVSLEIAEALSKSISSASARDLRPA
jgi:hypothetical protein